MPGRIRRESSRGGEKSTTVRSVVVLTGLLFILTWQGNNNNDDRHERQHWSSLTFPVPFDFAAVEGYLLPSPNSKRHSHHAGQWFGRRRSFHSVTTTTTTRTTTMTPRREQLGRRANTIRNKNYATAILSNDKDTEPSDDAVEDRQVLDVLWSYVKNLQRARKIKGDTKAAKSLTHYLQNNSVDSVNGSRSSLEVKRNEWKDETDGSNHEPSSIQSLREVLERALIPALRQAGEANDYRMILRLISNSIAFANDHPILTPRIFGEALNALSLTTANAAKLNSVWNIMMGNKVVASTSSTGNNKATVDNSELPSFLAGPPTAFELNTYLRAMAGLGKSKACIDIYQQYSTRQLKSLPTKSLPHSNVYIQPDAYTISILLSVLADSVSPDQKMCDPVDFSSGTTELETISYDTVQNRNRQVRARATSQSLRSRIESLTFSTCWQWNAAVDLLRTLPEHEDLGASNSRRRKIQWRNNHVYSSLLKLQDKAQDLCNGQSTSTRRHKNGPELTMAILDDMIRHDVIPDAVTCTQAIKAMGRAVVSTSASSSTPSMASIAATYDGKESNNLAVQFLEQMKSNPKLPHPNQYSYSAAIKACARLKDHRTALKLLEEMRSNYCATNSASSVDKETIDGDTIGVQIIPPPNTWVYNTALLSLDNKEKSKSESLVRKWKNKQMKKLWAQKNTEMSQSKRTQVALALLDQMKKDNESFGLDTKPDTITYNTILGIGTFPYQYAPNATETVNTEAPGTSTTISALSIIDEMKRNGVVRDKITYSNAIDSALHTNETIDILNECLRDATMKKRKPRNGDESPMTHVFNIGLYSLTMLEDFEKFNYVLTLMMENEVQMNSETLTGLIYTVGKRGKGSSLENLIRAKEEMENRTSSTPPLAHKKLLDSIGLVESVSVIDKMPNLMNSHYTEAIKMCLRENDFTNAYTILSMMRAKGINPSTSCMEGFALAYAQSAMDTIAKERNHKKPNEEKQLSACLSRASNAYKIAMALAHPRSSTLGRVARACAVTGQWNLCRTLLRSIHKNILTHEEDGSLEVIISPRVLETIRGTHSYILRECAKQANVHAALHYTSDIQEFNKKVRARNQVDTLEATVAPKFAEIPSDEDDIFGNLRGITDSLSSKTNVGMQPNDWISLIQAASKSGHWKVCFNTLQFLRPYVERTNQKLQEDSSHNSNSGDEKYNQLSQGLYTVTRSLEAHSQYAWAFRVIEDWIEWSGRQPRVESVLSAIRALASKGCVEEIRTLMDACLRDDLTKCSFNFKNYNNDDDDDDDDDVAYEKMLYAGTVTALHNIGLYDDADEMFMAGVQNEFLPFNFVREKDHFVLDLHGLNVALAHSAVRIAMRQQAATVADEAKSASGSSGNEHDNSNNNSNSSNDMMIITGKGRHSELYLRPVLRPEVQRMLLEEFYPPLNTMSIPGNIGALTILAHDIEAWQDHQQQQKGVRMLKLAGVLRNLSSQERLKQIIALRLESTSTNSTSTTTDGDDSD